MIRKERKDEGEKICFSGANARKIDFAVAIGNRWTGVISRGLIAEGRLHAKSEFVARRRAAKTSKNAKPQSAHAGGSKRVACSTKSGSFRQTA
jgi:hypothetical protein